MNSTTNILDAIERLNFVLRKVKDFEELDVELSEKILDNRVITLEGYLRYLDVEGIPKIKDLYNSLKGVE